MIKKVIKYTDYNGKVHEDPFYFNLNRAEVSEMEMSTSGGMIQYAEKIAREENGEKLAELFKTLILKSYGEKSPDGVRFIKSKELRDAFEQTEAYVELYMELSGDAKAAAEFFNGIVPQEKKPEQSN